MKRKDNSKILKLVRGFFNVFMMIATVFLIIYFIAIKKYDRVFSGITIYFTLFIPDILNNTKFSFNDKFKLIYAIFIFLAHFLGSIINLYCYVWWYDLAIHFVSGILTFVLALYILEKTGTNFKNNLVRFIYLLGFVSLIAISWEILEFSGDVLFNTNLQHNLETGVVDTMQDMIVAFLGGFLTYIYMSFNKKKIHG